MSDDTTSVSFELVDLSRVVARGKLLAVASVEILVAGVAIVVQGWRVLRGADGWAYVEPPTVRHVDGDWIPAVALPPELEEAIAQVIMREIAPTGMLVSAWPPRPASSHYDRACLDKSHAPSAGSSLEASDNTGGMRTTGA